MGTIDRYLAYAAAFEEAYASDDWSKLEPFLPKTRNEPCLLETAFAGSKTALPTRKPGAWVRTLRNMGGS
jgi:hypothetical protein